MKRISILPENQYCFVDEAGDLTLFNKKGKVVVGNEGISNYFFVGVAIIPDISIINKQISELRRELIQDPYFKNVPSLLPEARKTALYFHAKDDLPEVRREVFKLLSTFNIDVLIIVKRKSPLANFAQINFLNYGIKLNDNNIYDHLISRLFRNILHKAENNIIYFAQRGIKPRTESLNNAIRKAQENFNRKYGIISDKSVKIFSVKPHESAGLQVIDYYLWSVQRMYEKGEDRFFNILKDNFKLIMDIDDKRNKEYGEWYSSKNLLTLQKLKLVKS